MDTHAKETLQCGGREIHEPHSKCRKLFAFLEDLLIVESKVEYDEIAASDNSCRTCLIIGIQRSLTCLHLMRFSNMMHPGIGSIFTFYNLETMENHVLHGITNIRPTTSTIFVGK